MKNNREMPYYFSLYLDIVRFCAAIAVYLDHISSFPFTKDFFWYRLGSYGGIAVIVFFALSGYVIAYVTSSREKTIYQYASARISRIYSVVIVSIFITLIFDNIGLTLNPDFYEIKKVMHKAQSIDGYIASVLFVNEYQIFNFNGISPGSNGPYWSLSFEVTYYLIAGLFIFTRKFIALPIIIILLFIAGRTISVLFPIWCIGYLLYFVNYKNTNRKLLYFGFISSVFLISIIPNLAYYMPKDNFGFNFPWGRGPFNRNIIKDYLTVLFFAVNIICAREILSGIKIVNIKKTESLIRWLGSLTFPLYLIHFPSIALFASISPFEAESASNAAFVSALTFSLVIIATPVCDKLKCKIKDSFAFISNIKFSRSAY